MSDEQSGTRPRLRRRWTLGTLMLAIALAAVALAWYANRAREVARELALAEAERAKVADLAKREIEQLYAQMAKDREMLDKADEAMAKARESLDSSTQPAPPSIGSIPGQVKNIVKLLDERSKQEEKSRRFHDEVAEKIRARMEKEQLEKATTKPAEQPR